MQINCPHCNQAMQFDSQYTGMMAECPSCKKRVELKAPADPAPPPLPVEPPPQPLSAAEQLAQAEGIDLSEREEKNVSGQATAKAYLKDWKNWLPEVKSAYVPSGVMPSAAVIWMVLGVFVGVVGGVVTAVVVGGLGGLLMALVGYLLALVVGVCRVVSCLLIGLFILTVIGAYLATFGLSGIVSAGCTTWMGQLGKNRNALGAAFFSMVSAIVTMGLMWFAFKGFGGPAVLDDLFGAQPNDFDWAYLIAYCVGGVIAVIVAGWFATVMIAESKFCEECEVYMEDKKYRHLALGPTKAVAAAIERENITAAVELLSERSGEAGEPILYFCPKCNNGFFEMTAHFNVTYHNKEKEEDNDFESWMVSSLALSAEEVALFQAVRVEETS